MKSWNCALLSALALTGCSEARAVQIDTDDDAHCAALMTVAVIVGEDQGANPQMSSAVKLMDRWYSAKLVRLAEQKGAERVMAELKPLATYLESKPLGTFKTEILSCVDRAIANPAFKDFERLNAPR